MIDVLFTKKTLSSLDEIGQLETEFFKKRAYKNAIQSIKEWTAKHSNIDFYELADYTSLRGIGDGINRKILELKAKGTIEHLTALRANKPKEELDPKLYKVRKGYITKRIPYEDAMKYYTAVKSLGIKMQCAGSLRRKKELIGDVDILVSSENYSILIEKLKSIPGYEVLSEGDYKTSILIDKVNGIQMDIISVTPEDYPYQLLYLTGSQTFNIHLRSVAKHMGYKLNQKGLWYTDIDGTEKSFPARTEEDVFRYLHVDYVKPEDR